MGRISEFFRVLREFFKIIPALRFKPPADDAVANMALVLEEFVASQPGNTMLIFEGRSWTWSEFNKECNQLAHLLKAQGVRKGDSVAVFMENRAEYLIAVFALFKIGAVAGLINNSLVGRQLAHCVATIECRKCLFGEELLDAIDGVRAELDLKAGEDYLWVADRGEQQAPDWALDVRHAMADQPVDNLPDAGEVKGGDNAMYLFTSGTTGLPKAALQLNRKIFATAGALGRIGFRFTPTDRLYCCLPLYHMTGLVPGVFAAITNGASVVLRRKFSASHFWPEIRDSGANSLIYIGELCRYLVNQPEQANDADNPLVKMLGNGLRPDVWDEFKSRFAVERICEIYGASEGNIAFVNMLNKDRTIGCTPAKLALVKYDVDDDEVVRQDDGYCIPVARGEAGLLLGKVDEVFKFDGYKDKAASEAKLLRNVLEEGDCYFNTGDLIRQIDVGFAMGMAHYQFVDRTGDTFRWRAENVSTNEVGEILNNFEQFGYTNVYGVEVPGAEGRAGMVAVVMKTGAEFDPDSFHAYVQENLPSYAQPVFVRIQQDLATTGTFKLLKGELRKSAYHLDQVTDPLYLLPPRGGSYKPLTRESYDIVMAGQGGY